MVWSLVFIDALAELPVEALLPELRIVESEGMAADGEADEGDVADGEEDGGVIDFSPEDIVLGVLSGAGLVVLWLL